MSLITSINTSVYIFVGLPQNRILNYKEAFPEKLNKKYGEELNFHNLNKLTFEELERLLVDVKVSVADNVSSALLRQSFYGSLRIGEVLMTHKAGVDLSGLTTEVENDPKTEPTIQEACIELQEMAYIPPLQRLAIIVLSSTMAVYNKNCLKKLKAKEEAKSDQKLTLNLLQKVPK